MNVSQFFAWSATAGIIILFCMYPLKKHQMKQKQKEYSFVIKTSEKFHIAHKTLGILVFIFVLLHASFSSHQSSMYIGTLGLFFLIVQLFSFLGRKALKNKWIKVHKYFAITLVVILMIHIVLALLN